MDAAGAGEATGLGPPLPVDAVLPTLRTALGGDGGTAVLRAPPGSGKTTRVPLELLDTLGPTGGRVLVLEPRRVAARAAARRMASSLAEPVGQRVGYRIRQDRRTGPLTRIEVVTEGILTRMVQADPSLDGVAAVIFDEFHERSITSDLGLALCLDLRSGLRPDLRILVMSATLDTAAVAALLGGPPVVTADVAPHPVTTVWLGRSQGRTDAAVARAVRRAVAETAGDILVFLPGVGEIRAVERMLAEDALNGPDGAGIDVMALHGSLAGAAQDAALVAAAPGRRKVVLATAIAETSLTIDGVRAVVDSGLMRVARFDPAAGMTRLVTLPVSRSTAEQRQGRAARQGPGICYRLWSEIDHAGLASVTPPEILVADLAPLALDLAEWGVDDPAELRWIDPPPAGPLAAARQLLVGLGALDARHRITPHGRAMARIGLTPRLAHMLVRSAATAADAALACEVAAILGEGDPDRSGGRDADLTGRVELVRRGRAPRLREAATRLRALLGLAGAADTGGPVVPEDVGRLAALAFPDRVGLRRAGRDGHWLLRNGRGAWVPDGDTLVASSWVVAADLDGVPEEARIRLGAPLHPDDVEALFGADIDVVERVAWDERAGDVVAVRQRRLGPLVVGSSPLRRVEPAAAAAAILDGVRAEGLGLLPWTPAAERLRARVAFARRTEGERWADLGDDALLDELGGWVAPWVEGLARGDGPVRRAELTRLPLADALWARIGWDRRRDLDELAPTHLDLPSGARHRLEYPAEGPPVLTVRVQELFGTTASPAVAGGRVPVLLALTSPAGRPVQRTTDLAGFWVRTYPRVRAELRARYPRHPWPEDPLAAAPTSRPVPRRRPGVNPGAG